MMIFYKPKIILALSILSTIFLLSIQIFSYLSWGGQIVQIVVEMWVIPSLILLGFLFFFNLINVYKKKREYYVSFVLNFFTVLSLIISTVLDKN